ncbi:hypothetical protein GCM10010269_14850 [Streptomyces humidus]|uniref:NADP-dependent oxidoreductase domain-containing protein n=1 Tax=Streptomyces humidus TaxID=52259 RepID=A0A918L2D5_9ACTN|nr:hypothetical protein [Streptomyces humidus]GGR76683.1 hypothetical protein GCM10010269_14850 [Streptomyces humidus]
MHQRKIRNTSAALTAPGFRASGTGSLHRVTPPAAAAAGGARQAGLRHFDTAPRPGTGPGPLRADRPAEGVKDDCRDAPPARRARPRAVADVCAAHGTPLPTATIAFARNHPGIIDVTLGMRTPEQVVRNVELHGQRVPAGLRDDPGAQGLIRPAVFEGRQGGRDARCL